MLILTDNDLTRFRIKQLTKEIEAELKKFRTEEILNLKYRVVRNAWAELIHAGLDDNFLYDYMVKLERSVFKI